MKNWHIGEILVQKKLIDWKQLEEALDEQKQTRESVGEVLVRKQYLPKFLLFKALAERHAMPFVDLACVFIDPRTVERVPRSVAVKYGFMPIEMRDGAMVVGVRDPRAELPHQEIAAMAKVSGIKTVLCTPDAVNTAITQNYGDRTGGTGVSA
jgi:type IV pilus assembly protein PilB